MKKVEYTVKGKSASSSKAFETIWEGSAEDCLIWVITSINHENIGEYDMFYKVYKNGKLILSEKE